VEKPRKRGGVSKRGISDELVCVLVVQDRTKQTFSKAVCRGRCNRQVPLNKFREFIFNN